MNTSNQLLTKRAQDILSLVERPEAFVSIETTDPAFTSFMVGLKELEKLIANTNKLIKQNMIANNINEIKFDGGRLHFSPVTTFKEDGTAEDQFISRKVDKEAVDSYITLFGELPDGVTKVVTKKLNKNFDKVLAKRI